MATRPHRPYSQPVSNLPVEAPSVYTSHLQWQAAHVGVSCSATKDACMSNAAMCERSASANLSSIAALANILAKELKDRRQQQELAYRIKTKLCEMLIASGGARPINISPKGDIGFALEGNRQLHIPLRRLSPETRKVINEQIPTLPVVTPLRDVIKRRSR